MDDIYSQWDSKPIYNCGGHHLLWYRVSETLRALPLLAGRTSDLKEVQGSAWPAIIGGHGKIMRIEHASEVGTWIS